MPPSITLGDHDPVRASGHSPAEFLPPGLNITPRGLPPGFPPPGLSITPRCPAPEFLPPGLDIIPRGNLPLLSKPYPHVTGLQVQSLDKTLKEGCDRLYNIFIRFGHVSLHVGKRHRETLPTDRPPAEQIDTIQKNAQALSDMLHDLAHVLGAIPGADVAPAHIRLGFPYLERDRVPEPPLILERADSPAPVDFSAPRYSPVDFPARRDSPMLVGENAFDAPAQEDDGNVPHEPYDIELFNPCSSSVSSEASLEELAVQQGDLVDAHTSDLDCATISLDDLESIHTVSDVETVYEDHDIIDTYTLDGEIYCYPPPPPPRRSTSPKDTGHCTEGAPDASTDIVMSSDDGSKVASGGDITDERILFTDDKHVSTLNNMSDHHIAAPHDTPDLAVLYTSALNALARSEAAAAPTTGGSCFASPAPSVANESTTPNRQSAALKVVLQPDSSSKSTSPLPIESEQTDNGCSALGLSFVDDIPSPTELTEHVPHTANSMDAQDAAPSGPPHKDKLFHGFGAMTGLRRKKRARREMSKTNINQLRGQRPVEKKRKVDQAEKAKRTSSTLIIRPLLSRFSSLTAEARTSSESEHHGRCTQCTEFAGQCPQCAATAAAGMTRIMSRSSDMSSLTVVDTISEAGQRIKKEGSMRRLARKLRIPF